MKVWGEVIASSILLGAANCRNKQMKITSNKTHVLWKEEISSHK